MVRANSCINQDSRQKRDSIWANLSRPGFKRQSVFRCGACRPESVFASAGRMVHPPISKRGSQSKAEFVAPFAVWFGRVFGRVFGCGFGCGFGCVVRLCGSGVYSRRASRSPITVLHVRSLTHAFGFAASKTFIITRATGLLLWSDVLLLFVRAPGSIAGCRSDFLGESARVSMFRRHVMQLSLLEIYG